MIHKLTELYINDMRIRKRDQNDMKEWILGINSILFPESMPCEAYIDGLWRECILTGKLSDDGSGRLSMTVTFPNATVIKAGGTRNSFFIEPENN